MLLIWQKLKGWKRHCITNGRELVKATLPGLRNPKMYLCWKKYPCNSNLSLASFNLQLQAIVFFCCSYFLRERKVCVQLLPFHILHGITNAKHTLTFTPSTPHHPRPTLPTYWQARPSRALTKNVLQLQVALSAKYSNGIFFHPFIFLCVCACADDVFNGFAVFVPYWAPFMHFRW